MIKTITVDREYGSGGVEIAARLAKKLGWTLWDEALTRAVAERTRTKLSVIAAREERRDPLLRRLFQDYLYSFEGRLNLPRFPQIDAQRIATATSDVVHEAAAGRNSVIVGRGSVYFLQGRPDTLHVFVYAPAAYKLRRLVAEGLTPLEAKRRVEEIDRARTVYVRASFKKKWPTPSLYHLMVNAAVGEEAAVQMILHARSFFAERTTTHAQLVS